MAVGDTEVGQYLRQLTEDGGYGGAGQPLTSDQLEELMGLISAAPTQRFFSPEQMMSQFTAGAPRATRDALWRQYNPLFSRFQLGQIGTAPGFGDEPPADYLSPYGMNKTFADYLGEWGGGTMTPMGRPEMLRRAQQAAAFGRLSPTAVGEMLGGNRANEALYGYYTYGGGEEAAQNQRLLATQLALTPGRATAAGQAPPAYSHMMQQAITGAMGDIFASRRAAEPEENFLQWYLDRIDPGQSVKIGGLQGLAAQRQAAALGINAPALTGTNGGGGGNGGTTVNAAGIPITPTNLVGGAQAYQEGGKWYMPTVGGGRQEVLGP